MVYLISDINQVPEEPPVYKTMVKIHKKSRVINHINATVEYEGCAQNVLWGHTIR